MQPGYRERGLEDRKKLIRRIGGFGMGGTGKGN